MHHVLHAWEGLALFGSFSVVGNMPTDRLFKDLKKTCHRKRNPELSLMKSLNVSRNSRKFCGLSLKIQTYGFVVSALLYASTKSRTQTGIGLNTGICSATVVVVLCL